MATNLREQNNRLAEQAEDIELMALTSEGIKELDQPQEILFTVLEKIAITKNIPYCAYGTLSSSTIRIDNEYTTFADQATGLREILLSKPHLQQLRDTHQILDQVNGKQSTPPIQLQIKNFRPNTILVLPVSSPQIPTGIMLFADDDSDPQHLIDAKPILKQVLGIVTNRLDNCALLEKLNTLNKQFEEKVQARTIELGKMNKALKKENLQRQKAYSKLAEKQSHMETLLNVTSQLHRSIDLEQVLKTITDSMVHSFGYNTATIITRRDLSYTFTVQVISTRTLLPKIDQIIGSSIKNYTFEITPNINQAIATGFRGEIFITDNLSAIAYPILSKKVCHLLQNLRNTKKYILLPLQTTQDIVGCILLSSSEKEVVERDLEILKIFTRTAAQAIQNATLHYQSKQMEKALQRKTVEQQHLIETAKKLTTSLNTETVLQSFVQGACEILGANECTIYSHHQDNEYLTPIITVEQAIKKAVMSSLIPLKKSFVGQAILKGQGLIFNQPEDEILGFSIPGTPKLSNERILVVPLWEETQIIGAMRLNRVNIDFTTEDLSFAETFAAYASSALTNAKKHQELIKEIALRRRSERALITSEKRYRTITETAQDVILTINERDRILFVNRAVTKLLGYSSEELTGKSLSKLITPPLRDSYQKGMSTYLKTGKKAVRWKGFESIARHKNGKDIPVEVSFNSYQVGTKKFFTGIIRDITDRKQMHSALRNLAISFAKISGTKFYEAVCKHLITSLGMDYGYVGILIDNTNKIRVLGGYAKDKPLKAFTYSLIGSPCKKVIGQQLHCYSDHVLDQFPNNPLLHDWHVRSYLGTPLFDSSSQPLGICVLVSENPIEDPSMAKSMITIFAERIAAEVEREQTLLEVTLSLNELQWIDRINQTALSGKPLSEIIQRIREAITETCAAQAVTIYLYDTEHKKLIMQEIDTGNTIFKKVETLTGIRVKDFAPILKKGGRVTEALATGKGFLISDPDDIASLYREYTDSKTLKKFIPHVIKIVKPRVIGALPLKFQGEPLGLITFNTPRQLNQQDLSRLTRFSNQFAATLMWARAEKTIKRSLQEKELLLREIHHRVKNNLQVISSLLKLQSEGVTDLAVLQSLQESQMRIRSLALVHEKLYQSPDLSVIDFKMYIHSLTRDLISFYGIHTTSIDIVNKIPDLRLNIETAIPCGLIINELVSNALKHAFPKQVKGVIEIRVKTFSGAKIEILVKDNGVGLPGNFQWRKAKTLGLQLVKMLTEDQLQGKVSVKRKPGTEFKISFIAQSS